MDFGSNLLIIPYLPILVKYLIWDGYGAIGISISKLNPSCSITMVDINSRAVELAKNIDINQIVNAAHLKVMVFDVKVAFVNCNNLPLDR